MAGAAALTAACQRRKASGYSGYAFIANQEGEAVAAVDLTVFAVARHIRVQGRPSDVLAHPHLPRVYALTPENGSVHEIRADTLAFNRRVQVAGAAISMRSAPEAGRLYVLCKQPHTLAALSLDSFRVEWQLPLPYEPLDFEIDRLGKTIAVSYGRSRSLAIFPIDARSAGAPLPCDGDLGSVRFLSDSKTLIAANLSERTLSLYDVASRALIVNLPLAVRPDHLCFNADGGQLFITGDGMDAVAVVYPYYTPQVAETVLAGHAPGTMAASLSEKARPQYLFVANPKSGEVSILDITTRKVIAVTPVGSDPGHIVLTPDDQYALVLNQGSGDLAVIRVANITRAVTDFKKSRKGPLFMMIPVGSKPVSAAVMSI